MLTSRAIFRLSLFCAAPLTMLAATPAQAEECLLDTNQDGTATAGVDTQGGAQDSENGGDRGNLSCGPGAGPMQSAAPPIKPPSGTTPS